MSKRESIARYNLIINKLRRFPASFNEIMDYLQSESELQDYNFVVSKRTFQRDLNDIRSIFNIDIQFDVSRQAYFIDFDEEPEVNKRIFEAFDIFNALKISDRISDFIHFEKRNPQGTENLFGLLHALKNSLIIKFMYKKFYADEITERMAEPYALKEFKNRWYVLAKDLKDNSVKSFALDRLSELEITKTKFNLPIEFNVQEHYLNSFGIISPNNQFPEKIILSFDSFQGEYIKSLPIHESQEIIKDDGKELLVQVNLHITLDFIMEILSFGNRVKVIQPLSLINEVEKIYKAALKQYESPVADN